MTYKLYITTTYVYTCYVHCERRALPTELRPLTMDNGRLAFSQKRPWTASAR